MKLKEKKQQQTQRILRNFAIFITIISYSSYFLFKESEMNYNIKPSAVVVGEFFGLSLIPLVFWIIYGLVAFSHKNTLIKLKQEKIDKINSRAPISKEFNSKLNALKELLDVKAITQLEFESKKKLLIRDTERLVIADENVKLKQQQLKKLEEALNKGVITEEEYRTKLDSLK